MAVAQAGALAVAAGVAERCRFLVADLDDGLPPGPPVDLLLCHRFRVAAGALLQAFGALDALEVLASGEGGGEAWILARRR